VWSLVFGQIFECGVVVWDIYLSVDHKVGTDILVSSDLLGPIFDFGD